MTGSGSPCGACKFLRRKCMRGCVFAPYFCHEQGASHFAAIHKVFGASNVSKLLAHLPLTHRSEAAATISYEAQARIHDPIYGCVSHIFALQQQVVNLQAQLASLKAQANIKHTNLGSGSCTTGNPNHDSKTSFDCQQDVQNWFQPQTSNMIPQFDQYQTLSENVHEEIIMNSNSWSGNYENSVHLEGETVSFSSFEDQDSTMDSLPSVQTSIRQWSIEDDFNDLQSVALAYIQ